MASYLLQATESNDEPAITEAENMLTNLLADLHQGLLPSLTPSEFATSSPEVVTPISQASSFTSPIAVVTENIEVIDLAKVETQKPEDELF
jgi:hypothetical protein